MTDDAVSPRPEWPAPRGWWPRVWLQTVCVGMAAAIVTVVGINALDAINADQMQACERIGGEVVAWYDCLSPDGQIVDPSR